MNDFKSLEADLDAFFDTAYSDLPQDLRDRVDMAFIASWERLDAEQRREAARQWDYQHDPDTLPEREEFESIQGQIFALERQIEEWEATVAPTANDRAIKEQKIDSLRERLLNLGAGGSDIDGIRSDSGLTNNELDDCVNRFIRVGEYWKITFNGVTKHFEDTKGLRYICYLMQHQGKEVHVRDLHHAINPPAGQVTDPVLSAMASEQLEELGLSVGDLGDAGDELTLDGKKRIRAGLEQLQEQMDEAASQGNEVRQAELEAERERILRYLVAGSGLGGRQRKASSGIERIRKAVTKRIQIDIKKIGHHHAALGHHLTTQLQTGTQCRYAPQPPVEWKFSAN